MFMDVVGHIFGAGIVMPLMGYLANSKSLAG